MLQRNFPGREVPVTKTKIMVALRDAESVESLVTLACQMSSGMDAELAALHVVQVPMATPLEADDDILTHPGKEILAQAERVAAERFKKKISTQLLRAREIGEAIVGEVKDQGVDLLIMRYHRPQTLGEILLGSTVQYVGRRAPCRLLVEVPAPDRP